MAANKFDIDKDEDTEEVALPVFAVSDFVSISWDN